MKINEVLEPSENALFEAFDADNDTGLMTKDLVKLAKSKDGPWSGPMTSTEFDMHLAEMAEKYGATL